MSYLNLKAYLNKDFLILGQSTHYAFSQPPTVKANKYFHSIARCLEAGTVADLDPAACAAASRMVPHPVCNRDSGMVAHTEAIPRARTNCLGGRLAHMYEEKLKEHGLKNDS